MEKPLAGLAIVRALSSNQRAREECLRRVWRDLYPRLNVFVRAFDCRMEAEAEDLVQEIMEKLFKGIDSYNPVYSFSTWAFAIARNHCLDHLRRRRAEPHVSSLSDLPDLSQPVHEITPEHVLLGKNDEARMASFMEAVDPDTKQLAFLRFHQGLGYREISRVMGIPVGTVKFRVHKLREKMRAHLGGDDA